MNVDTSNPDLSKRTVIITGAGGGLGRGISHRLLLDGFRCVLADLNEAALQESIALAGADGVRGTTVVCDLRLVEDRRRLVAFAADQPGSLFGLVHSAGIAVADALLDETLTDWRKTLEINLEAAFFLAQQAFEHMRPQREGRVVNIASVYGVMGFNNQGYGARAPETTLGDRGPVRQSAYAASKGGLIQLTRDLAAAVGRWGITVNAVSPGSIPHASDAQDHQTDEAPGAIDEAPSKKPGLGDKVDPEILKALAAQVPLGRLGRVGEIAGPVRFLLSDDATYITGVNLVVDGGWSIW